LIYIKNYQALNDLVAKKQNDNYIYPLELSDMIGKPITVFVNGGGASGSGFTGILIEVLCDSIKLITAMPSAPTIHKNRSCKKKHCSNFGTCTTIMLNHITAITYNFV